MNFANRLERMLELENMDDRTQYTTLRSCVTQRYHRIYSYQHRCKSGNTLNTDNFRNTAQIALVRNDIADIYIEATNRALMLLAEKQIKTAFETSEHEVEFLYKRTSKGVQRAIAEGKQVGRATGVKVNTKKSVEAKEKIIQHSVDFGGTLKDAEVMELTHLARNTYYKYKRELKEEIERNI